MKIPKELTSYQKYTDRHLLWFTIPLAISLSITISISILEIIYLRPIFQFTLFILLLIITFVVISRFFIFIEPLFTIYSLNQILLGFWMCDYWMFINSVYSYLILKRQLFIELKLLLQEIIINRQRGVRFGFLNQNQ